MKACKKKETSWYKDKKIKTYSEFCKTDTGKNNQLTEEEIIYYTSKNNPSL